MLDKVKPTEVIIKLLAKTGCLVLRVGERVENGHVKLMTFLVQGTLTNVKSGLKWCRIWPFKCIRMTP